MSMAQAFGITEDDLEIVLRNNAVHVANADGKSFEEMSHDIFNDWHEEFHDRVADAALKASCDMGEQTDAAHAEIREIFVETGVLKR